MLYLRTTQVVLYLPVFHCFNLERQPVVLLNPFSLPSEFPHRHSTFLFHLQLQLQ